MKRVISLLTSLLLLTALLGACSNGAVSSSAAVAGGASTSTVAPVETKEQTIIAVALRPYMTSQMAVVKGYLDTIAGPKYNCKFIYSEELKSVEDEINFIENSQASGAVGVIDYCLFNIPQIISLCEDLEMYVSFHIQLGNDLGQFKYYTGNGGFANPPKGAAYKHFLTNYLDEGFGKGILITSGLASSGNPQQVETTKACLEALQEHYGLTYETDIDTLVTTATGVEAKNDKGINIYVFPGGPMDDGFLTGLSSLLTTGKYDILIPFEVRADIIKTVDEAEQIIKSDIKVGGIASISDETTAIINSKDSTGDDMLNGVYCYIYSYSTATMFALVYNGITGHGDEMKTDTGSTRSYGSQGAIFDTVEQYNTYKNWDDPANNSYAFTEEMLSKLVVETNPEWTQDGFDALIGINPMDTI